MKIGIFDPYLDTMSGGEKYMLSVALCLKDKHDVTIFWDTNKKNEIIQKAKDRFGFDLNDFIFTPSIFSPNVAFLARLIDSRNYDYIIYLSDGSIPLLATKLIVHFQSPMPWLHTGRVKMKIKTRRVSTFVCNSQFTKSYIDKSFHIQSKVIYPPISLQKNTTIKKENEILHVGRFGINHAGSSYKKQEVLIEIFKRLVDGGVKNWQLTLVVSVTDVDKEKITILEEHIKNYPIKLIVNPSNETLWEQYAKAKIYWHASGFGEDLQAHPDRAEHFGMSTVEAMGMGAVPIVIKAGGQTEIVQHEENGFLWSTQDQVLEYTKRVIDDTTLWETLSKNAEKRAEDFSLENFCKRFSDIIT